MSVLSKLRFTTYPLLEWQRHADPALCLDDVFVFLASFVTAVMICKSDAPRTVLL